MTYDLVIVGGGVWGSAAAGAAVRGGARSVLLLEANIGLAQESSAKSGGILTDLLWHPEDQAFVMRSRDLYQQAREASGDVSVARRVGMLTLAEGEHVASLHGRTKDLVARQIPFDILDRDEIVRRYPSLDRLRGDTVALWTPEDWHLNPTAYAQQATAEVRASGLAVRTASRVGAIRLEGGKVFVQAGGETYEGHRALIAAGTWTRKLVRTAGLDLALLPYRVQLSSLELQQPHGLPIVWHLSTDVYMVPDGEKDVLAGDGTRLAEFDPDDYQTSGDDQFEEEIAERLLLVSSLGEQAGLRSSWAGLVGATPDRRPLLGRLADRLYVACGDNGIGVMRGPAIGELAAKVALDLAEAPHLRPDRFPAEPFEIRPGFTLD